MYKKELVVVVGVRVGFVDIVDGDQVVEFIDWLTRCLCGGSWGLTLGNPCMQSQ